MRYLAALLLPVALLGCSDDGDNVEFSSPEVTIGDNLELPDDWDIPLPDDAELTSVVEHDGGTDYHFRTTEQPTALADLYEDAGWTLDPADRPAISDIGGFTGTSDAGELTVSGETLLFNLD